MFGSPQDQEGIYRYLPQNDDGLVLFTTRSRDVAIRLGGEIVDLVEMNEEEAKGLLQNSLSRKDLPSDSPGVKSLLQELTYLPLAITQAAAYLDRNRVPIAKYVDMLRGTEHDTVGLMTREF